MSICENVENCVYEIMRIGRFLRIECFLQSEKRANPRVRPHKDIMVRDFKDEKEVGRWEGWGYVYAKTNV